MIRARAVVDYDNFRSGEVVIFVDMSNPGRAFGLLQDHAPALERTAGIFGARILLAEEKKIDAETIVESETADAWILLVAEGRNRSMAGRNNPQRINVDAGGCWESYAFRELVRQLKESNRIIEDLTDYYGRLTDGPKRVEAPPLWARMTPPPATSPAASPQGPLRNP